MDLGEKIRRARQLVGLTQREFAAQLGLSHSAVAKYETNQAEPNQAMLRKMADVLRIDLAAFLVDNYEISLRIVDPRTVRMLRTFEGLPPIVKKNVLNLIDMAAEIAGQRQHQSEPAPVDSCVIE